MTTSNPLSPSTIEKITGHLKRKRGSDKPVHTYKVSVMGPSLDKPHIQSVQASTPGEALDMVLRAAGCTDCTQYGVLHVSSTSPHRGKQGAA